MNGTPIDKVRDWYVTNTGYVLQLATPYYEELTVRENVTLAAQMRLHKSVSLDEKFERVEQVMREVTMFSPTYTPNTNYYSIFLAHLPMNVKAVL